MRYFNGTITLEEAISLHHVYLNSLSEVVVAVDGAYEVLEELSKKYEILVATNGPVVAVNAKLASIDCLKFIKEVLSAEMFGYMKPKQEFFEGIKKLLNNYNNDEYLIIGNSLKSDVGFGMNCGFDSCWFDKGVEELTNDYRPTMIIRNLNELINKL